MIGSAIINVFGNIISEIRKTEGASCVVYLANAVNSAALLNTSVPCHANRLAESTELSGWFGPPAAHPARPRNTNRGSFPKYPPCIEGVIAPEQTLVGGSLALSVSLSAEPRWVPVDIDDSV